MKETVKEMDLFDDQLADELERNFPTIPLRPKRFGITAKEYADKVGITENNSMRRLRGMVANKGWKSKIMLNATHRPTEIFYKPKPGTA